MSGAEFRYVPADPLGVTSVDRTRLYTSAARTDPPVVDIVGAIAQPDGSWLITVPDSTPDGTYYTIITVTYADGSTLDANDSLTLPLATVGQPGDPINPWVSATDLAADSRLSGVDSTLVALAAQGATEILWMLSGRRFGGLRTADMYVLPPACGCDTAPASSSVDLWGPQGNLVGWWPAGWVFGCACRAEVTLPDQPVSSIIRVTVDGTTVDPDGYRLDSGRTLVRVDGTHWPLMSAGLSDVITPRMRVLYLWGQAAPASGVMAARAYATELALAAAGQDCRLPDRVTSITRQDVIKTFADPLQLVENGLTGLSVVDGWVRAVNPHGHSGIRPRVLSPDLPRVRSTT